MTEDLMTDEEQLQEVKRLWSEYGAWIAGAVLIATIGIFGYRYYQRHVETLSLEAAQQFLQLTDAYQRGDNGKARQIAEHVVAAYAGSPYADQAKLMLARLDLTDGKVDLAHAALTDVMDNSKDTELRHVARLRLARLQIDEGKADEALKTLSDDPGAFAARYHDVRGDAYRAKKDDAKALAEYKAALAAGSAATDPNQALLTLKIADLGAAPAAVSAAAPAAAPATAPANTPNEAKP